MKKVALWRSNISEIDDNRAKVTINCLQAYKVIHEVLIGAKMYDLE